MKTENKKAESEFYATGKNIQDYLLVNGKFQKKINNPNMRVLKNFYNFFLKELSRTFKLYFLLLTLLIPAIQAWITFRNTIATIQINDFLSITNYAQIDVQLFWGTFLQYFMLVSPLIIAIFSSDIISNDFTQKTVMILYSLNKSRLTILFAKIIAYLTIIFIATLFSFLTFFLLLYFEFGITISFKSLLLGFCLTGIITLFAFSFGFLSSVLFKNLITGVILSIFYFFFGISLFSLLNIEQISVLYHFGEMINNVINAIGEDIPYNFLLPGEFYTRSSMLILVDVAFMGLGIYVFLKMDLRINN